MPGLRLWLLQCLLACLLLAPCRHASSSTSAARALDLRGVLAAGGSAEKDEDTRRQLQVQVELHHLPMRARSCRPAFDPSCELYPYIRYWNRRFSERDCQQSPLRHPLGPLAPIEQRKYVVFEPDAAQWNNIRMAAEVVILFAHATGRTLVLPAMQMRELHARSGEHQTVDVQDALFGGSNSFFDFDRIREAIDVITMEDFLATVAAQGLLSKPLPTDVPIKQMVRDKRRLGTYLEESCYTRPWNTEGEAIVFNFSKASDFTAAGPGAAAAPHLPAGSTLDPVSGGVINPVVVDARLKRFVSHTYPGPTLERKVVPYDAEMHSQRAIYFPGETHRVLAVWYSYLYFANSSSERLYRRIARDRLRAQDGLMCAVGRVVHLLHQDAAQLAAAPVRPPPRIGSADPPGIKPQRSLLAAAPSSAAAAGGAGEDQPRNAFISTVRIRSSAAGSTGHTSVAGGTRRGRLALTLSDLRAEERGRLSPEENGKVEALLAAAAVAVGDQPLAELQQLRIPSAAAGSAESSSTASSVTPSTPSSSSIATAFSSSTSTVSSSAISTSSSRDLGVGAPASSSRRLSQQAWSTPLEQGRDKVQVAQQGNPQTLGGDTRFGATYHAMHIRRKDFQFSYKNTFINETELYELVSPLLNRSVTRLLYIATDETNLTYFKPFETDFELRFLSDYVTRAQLGDKLMSMHMQVGFVEQMICANAHTFIGTPLSTFSGYITRLRGFYRDDRYSRTFYTLRWEQKRLHEHKELYVPFWSREWSTAHENIDEHDR